MSDVFCVDFPTYIIYSRFLFSSIIYAGNQRSCKNIRFDIKIVLRISVTIQSHAKLRSANACIQADKQFYMAK